MQHATCNGSGGGKRRRRSRLRGTNHSITSDLVCPGGSLWKNQTERVLLSVVLGVLASSPGLVLGPARGLRLAMALVVPALCFGVSASPTIGVSLGLCLGVSIAVGVSLSLGGLVAVLVLGFGLGGGLAVARALGLRLGLGVVGLGLGLAISIARAPM